MILVFVQDYNKIRCFRINNSIDDALVDILMPLADAWRSAHIAVTCTFRSSSAFRRSFQELLLCHSLYLNLPNDVNFDPAFLQWAAARGCRELELSWIPLAVRSRNLAEWLGDSTSEDTPKKLRVSAKRLIDNVGEFIGLLRRFVCL